MNIYHKKCVSLCRLIACRTYSSMHIHCISILLYKDTRIYNCENIKRTEFLLNEWRIFCLKIFFGHISHNSHVTYHFISFHSIFIRKSVNVLECAACTRQLYSIPCALHVLTNNCDTSAGISTNNNRSNNTIHIWMSHFLTV